MATPGDETPLPTELLNLADRCAAPTAVRVALTRLSEAAPDALEAVAADAALAHSLISVLAASRSLTRLLEARPKDSLAVLAANGNRLEPNAASPEDLVSWRNLEFLRIAARDLTGLDTLDEVGANLAALGRDVLQASLQLTEDDNTTIAVIGMGKLGGNELNYSSDIDVLFVGEGPLQELDRRARAIMDIARRCFRVDAR